MNKVPSKKKASKKNSKPKKPAGGSPGEQIEEVKMAKTKLFRDERTGVILLAAAAGKEVELPEVELMAHMSALNSFVTSQSELKKILEA